VKASDVMVTNVITVGPNTGAQDAARILLTSRISAVPVVGEHGGLLGIVSEGDLMRRSETDTERHRSWWLDLFVSNDTLAGEFAKAHSRKVADIMTREVITAAPDASLGEIAALLEMNLIKRVPIVKDGKLVGIVSRANLGDYPGLDRYGITCHIGLHRPERRHGQTQAAPPRPPAYRRRI
jgi:CBS domain-containing protein